MDAKMKRTLAREGIEQGAKDALATAYKNRVLAMTSAGETDQQIERTLDEILTIHARALDDALKDIDSNPNLED
jgi:hypothetical protein